MRVHPLMVVRKASTLPAEICAYTRSPMQRPMRHPRFVIPALAAGISPGHTSHLVGSRFPAELGMTKNENWQLCISLLRSLSPA